MTLALIGDVHGKYEQYLQIIENYDYTIQLGDHGFKYDHLNSVNNTKHKILAGNHDNYDIINQYPHFLGDYGTINIGRHEIFFIRGANSIDKHHRIPFINWWPDEELNYATAQQCVDAYKIKKPDIVISHASPNILYDHIPIGIYGLPKRGSVTEQLLDQCFAIHEPKLWFFGHHHISLSHKLNNTVFTCVGELDAYVLQE